MIKAGRITQCAKCAHAAGAEARTKHGLSDHPLFDTWKNMMGRCYDPRHVSYPKYGGRGIVVCDRWHDVAEFIKDMNPRPRNTTLDRVDNDGNYSPENCRWATRIQQANNTSVNAMLTYKGATRSVTEWGRILGILDSTIRERLKAGWTVEEALSTGGNKRKW